MRLAQASVCIISFVECHTKTTQTMTLQPGDSGFYSEWENGQCVRKKYDCPSNKGG
jgi:hypothetical protein